MAGSSMIVQKPRQFRVGIRQPTMTEKIAPAGQPQHQMVR